MGGRKWEGRKRRSSLIYPPGERLTQQNGEMPPSNPWPSLSTASGVSVKLSKPGISQKTSWSRSYLRFWTFGTGKNVKWAYSLKSTLCNQCLHHISSFIVKGQRYQYSTGPTVEVGPSVAPFRMIHPIHIPLFIIQAVMTRSLWLLQQLQKGMITQWDIFRLRSR